MNDVAGIHLLHPTMSLPCQVKQLVPEGPAKRPWRPLRHQQPTLTLRAWQKRWALHGNVPNWKSRRRWRWQRFSNIASFHDANAYFPHCLFFLFRFLVFASIARGWFLWILSSCRNPDSNLEVFSRFVCPSLPSTMGGLIFRLHPERQHQEALKLLHWLSLAAKPDFMPPACFQQAKPKLHLWIVEDLGWNSCISSSSGQRVNFWPLIYMNLSCYKL